MLLKRIQEFGVNIRIHMQWHCSGYSTRYRDRGVRISSTVVPPAPIYLDLFNYLTKQYSSPDTYEKQLACRRRGTWLSLDHLLGLGGNESL